MPRAGVTVTESPYAAATTCTVAPSAGTRPDTASRAREALGDRRVVGLVREERVHVQGERLGASGWAPGRHIIDQHDAFVTRLPNFDCFGVAIHDPILGHVVALKRAALGTRSWRADPGNNTSQMRSGLETGSLAGAPSTSS